MMSGRHRVRYHAKILAWESEIVRIRDRDGKEHTLKEKYIVSMTPANSYLKSMEEVNSYHDGYEQQDLFKDIEFKIE